MNDLLLRIEKQSFTEKKASLAKLDYNELDKDGNTYLMLACKNVLFIAYDLIDCHPEHANRDGKTALIILCSNNNPISFDYVNNVALMLIEGGNCNAEQFDTIYGGNALTYACQNQYSGIALTLLTNKKMNCHPEHVTRDGKTALIFACNNKMVEVALKLIKQKDCNPRQTDMNDTTALMLACINKLDKVALEIIKLDNCNPGQADVFESTALMYACKHKMERVAFALIKREDCNPGHVDSYESTALIYACQQEMIFVALALLDRFDECNPYQEDQYNNNAFNYAIIYYLLPVIDRFIQQQEMSVKKISVHNEEEITHIVNQLNKKYSTHLTLEKTKMTMFINYQSIFLKSKILSAIYEDKTSFHVIHYSDTTIATDNDIKTNIEQMAQALEQIAKFHLTQPIVIKEIIEHYFVSMVDIIDVIENADELVELIIQLNETGMQFILKINRLTGEITAINKSGFSVSNTQMNIFMIDQTIQQTIQSFLNVVSDIKLPEPDFIDKTHESLEVYRNKGIQQILAFTGYDVLEKIFYSYLMSKYKSGCYKSEHTISFNIDSTDLNESQILGAKYAAKCILDESEMFIIPIFINHESAKMGHANFIVYRKRFHTLEHFEPHGNISPFNETHSENFDAQLTRYVELINQELSHKVHFIHSNQICPGPGLQWIESASKLISTSDEHVEYCVIWNIFFAELCLKNPDKTSKELIRYIFTSLPKDDNTANVLRRICQGYVHILYEKIDKYVSRHFPNIQLKKGISSSDLKEVAIKLRSVLDVEGNDSTKMPLSKLFDEISSPVSLNGKGTHSKGTHGKGTHSKGTHKKNRIKITRKRKQLLKQTIKNKKRI